MIAWLLFGAVAGIVVGVLYVNGRTRAAAVVALAAVVVSMCVGCIPDPPGNQTRPDRSSFIDAGTYDGGGA